MTSEQKKDFWQQHIQACNKSKLKQKVYCQQQDISFASFGYWRTRLKRMVAPAKKLVPVTIMQASAVVVITLPVGIRIDVPVQILDEVLSVVVRRHQGVTDAASR